MILAHSLWKVRIYPSYSDQHIKITVGLVLEGASWVDDQLVLNQGESTRLDPSQVRWIQIDDVVSHATFVNLPVYLNNDRSDVLFTVDLPFDRSAGALVSTRAVCLTACG